MADTDDVSKIIAAIRPETFQSYKTKKELDDFKKKIKDDFWDAVKSASPTSPSEFQLTYDSSSETLEPVYFWILDHMNGYFGGKVEKLVDNFASSPGSGHFSEMGMRATRMQEEGMKIMQTIGVLVKSLVNIIYDLREFELRLSQYKSANSKEANESEAGILALKQIWMDNVDIKRGRGSINMLAQDLQFVTLRDAFMAAKTVDDIKKIDLNDRVKRILEPRVLEFWKWKDLSEKELKKRYDIERAYLKNQVAGLKMYTRWAKPYLRAASQLQMQETKNPALVHAFDTTILQLTLFGKNKFKFEDAIIDKKLPQSFKHQKLKRDYFSCVLVDLYFRGIPQKAGQHYTFGGRVEAKFKGYALNEEELKILNDKMSQSDLNEALKLSEGMTNESLDALREDIEYFTKDLEERNKEEKTKSSDTNPFTALFSFKSDKKEEKKKEDKKKDKKKDEKKEPQDISSDNYMEKMVRKMAQDAADSASFTVFDIYKKAHGMPSYPAEYDFSREG